MAYRYRKFRVNEGTSGFEGRSCRHAVLVAALALLVVLSALSTRAAADEEDCQQTIPAELVKLDKKVLKEQGKCLVKQRQGKEPLSTDCFAPTQKVTDAIDKFNEKLTDKCAGVTLENLGFPGSCPDPGGPPFAVADLLSCLVPHHTNQTTQMLGLVVGSAAVELTDKDQEKCQAALVKLATNGGPTRAKALSKCWKTGDATDCGEKLDAALAKNRKLVDNANKTCAGVKSQEFISVMGIVEPCSGEGGSGGITECALTHIDCLADAGLALGHPGGRTILDLAGRAEGFPCTGVAVGMDAFPSTAMIAITIPDPFAPGGCSEVMQLSGPTVVGRQSQVGNTIDTEIVSMQLQGFSSCLGEMVTLQQSPSQPSLGQINNVQLDEVGSFVNGDSFFHVFVRIEPDTMPPLINVSPFVMVASIGSLPPRPPRNTFTSTGPVQLALESNPSIFVATANNVTHTVEDDICCDLKSFVKTGDSYDDTKKDKNGNKVSEKNAKFTFMVNAGENPEECILVNWVQGSAKANATTFFKATVYGNLVDINFPTKGVDSTDTDPAYWSEGATRWRYVKENKTTAYATDRPGPADSSETGATYALKFMMCIYCIDDVPANAPQAGTGIGTAKQCINWDYSVVVAADGTFTHPALP